MQSTAAFGAGLDQGMHSGGGMGGMSFHQPATTVGPPMMNNYGMGYSKYLNDAGVIASWTYLCASRYEHTEPIGAVDAWGQRQHDGTRRRALC